MTDQARRPPTPGAEPPGPTPDVEPVDPEGFEIEDETPELVRRPAGRRVVGPFSLRHVTIAGLALMGTAIALTLATVPIRTIVPPLPAPEASAFLIGSPVPGLRIGDLAPEFAVDRPEGRLELTDLDGRPIRLAELRGKAVWINFWASWCPPCQFETPTIRALDEKYRDRGLVIVAIQVQQTVEDGRRYAERYGLEYTIGADVTGSIFHAYRVFALPTQFFIDPQGRITSIVNGPLNDERATGLIESILPPGSFSAPTASNESTAPAARPAATP